MTAAPESRPKRTATPRFLTSVPAVPDLTWLVNEAEASLGYRSTHGALVAMIETGGVSRGSGVLAVTYSDGGRDVDIEQAAGERRLLSRHHRRSADQARRLRARFLSLTTGPCSERNGTDHRAVLCEAYASRRLPRETDAPLGALAGVALLTAAVGGRGEWLLGLCRKPGQNAEALEAIRREAYAMVLEAVDAWRATGDGGER